jgi:2-dehydro-3-deoxy-D-arabinonate dehydratase
MRIVRYKAHSRVHLGVLVGEEVIEITNLRSKRLSSFLDLALEASRQGVSIDDLLKTILDEAGKNLPTYSYASLESGVGDLRLIIPLDPPEVWGCGVTYKRSQEAREYETGIKGVYNLVYDAPRPEIFFKGTAHRCVGPGEEICIRGDSRWNVPEPELAFILGVNQEIIGFTIANDVSSRDIEGENPLYLPQAKIYEGCCALGPAIVTVDEVGAEPKLRIECRVIKSDDVIFEGSVNTSQMKRSFEELRSYLCMYNPVPFGSVCMTGTGIVPPDDFSLEEGDIVEISAEKIGTLRNRVKRLRPIR